MPLLRNLTLVLFGIMILFTILVVQSVGLNFVAALIRDLTSLTWSGHVVLDFLCYLILSALWVAWRHDFSTQGWVLAVIVFMGATLAFAPYLLFAIQRAKGDLPSLLLGDRRARDWSEQSAAMQRGMSSE